MSSKLSTEDQALITKYKSRILEAAEDKASQSPGRNLPKLKTLESAPADDVSSQLQAETKPNTKSPVNRLNAIIFDTTDRQRSLESQKGNPRGPEKDVLLSFTMFGLCP